MDTKTPSGISNGRGGDVNLYDRDHTGKPRFADVDRVPPEEVATEVKVMVTLSLMQRVFGWLKQKIRRKR